MIMSECTISVEQLRKFFEEELELSEIRSLKSHLLTCSNCRNEAIKKDPVLIFSLLSLQEKEKSFWKGHWDGIAHEISSKKMWPWRIPLLQPSPVAAALAAVIVITIISIITIMNVGHVEQTAQKLHSTIEYGITEKAELTFQTPIVDTTVQPTARVITLSVGDADVVMIFDENMDI